jgi:hypothetical protein
MSNKIDIEILDAKLKNSELIPTAIWITSGLLSALKSDNRITSRTEGGIMHVDVLDGTIDLNIADNISDGSAFSRQELLSV